MSSSAVQRDAMGRYAEIGDFYNLPSEQLTSANIFKRAPPSYILQTVQSSSTTVDYVFSDTFDETINGFKIGADVTLSLMFGLIKISAGATITNRDAKSSRLIRNDLVYNVLTYTDILRVSHRELRSFVSESTFKKPAGTHVVVGILWGANTSITFEDRETTADNQTSVEGRGLFKKPAEKMQELLKDAFQRGHEEKTVKLTIKADIQPSGFQPRTISDLKVYTEKIPDAISAVNDGKGRQLIYILLPAAQLAAILHFESPAQSIHPDVDSAVTSALIAFSNELDTQNAELTRVRAWLTQRSGFSPAFEARARALKTREDATRLRVKNSLIAVRSGLSSSADLLRCVDRELIQASRDFLADLRAQIVRVEFVETLSAKGVSRISLHEVNRTLLSHTSTLMYFLYSSDTLDCFETNCMFLKLVLDGHPCVFVDLDRSPDAADFAKSVIRSYKDGWVCMDVREELEAAALKHYARCRLPLKYCRGKPVKATLLESRCPCGGESSHWQCPQCDENIYLDQEGYLYCDCGKALSYWYEFRCPEHEEYNRFTDRATLNILNLSPTRVIPVSLHAAGSFVQWVNTFAYLLYFDGVDAARANVFYAAPSGDEQECYTVEQGEVEGEREVINVRYPPVMFRIAAGGTSGVVVSHGATGSAGADVRTVEFGGDAAEGHPICINALRVVLDETGVVGEGDRATWEVCVAAARNMAAEIIKRHEGKH